MEPTKPVRKVDPILQQDDFAQAIASTAKMVAVFYEELRANSTISEEDAMVLTRQYLASMMEMIRKGA